MELVAEELQMYLRDMPEARQRETTGDAVRVGYNHCPPRLLTT